MHFRFHLHRPTKAGRAPGVPVHVGPARSFRPRVRVFEYGEDRCDERELAEGELPSPPSGNGHVLWVNVDGIHDVDLLLKIGERFGMHPLLLEDVANGDQRPKLEEFEKQLYLVLKMVQVDPTTKARITEQISVIVGEGYVVSFQEQPGDVFDPIRERIRRGNGRIRRMGADYLGYAIVDAVVDHYFVALEAVAEHLTELERHVFSPDGADVKLEDLYRLRTELAALRRAIWPARDAVNGLRHSESPLLDKETGPFLADVYDHVLRVIETLETFRELASGLVDTQISIAGQRMNEVMKVLTIIATIFIPLSFMAGVYGMNFDTMPELHHPWGYPALLGAMALVGFGMLVFFRRKRWL